MVKRNENFLRLAESYLFPEIQKRKREYQALFPEAALINLGIGDTTQPLSAGITESLIEKARALVTREGYVGYGPEQGLPLLRQRIAETFYQGRILPEEVFVSDGAKCDTGRLLQMFSKDLVIAVQNPTYPVYIDTSVISGLVRKIHLLSCTPENGFFPDLEISGPVDLIFFCAPNNPTGATATHSQLEKLVAFAKEKKACILFDAAYAFFIRDPTLPRSIYEIPGAEEVAIEIQSFSKMAGFTGLRLGWSVVPKALSFEDGSSMHQAWTRVTTTFFNGASCLAQAGGVAVLSPEGLSEMGKIRDFYFENATLIKEAFENLGIPCYGGDHSPFIWADFRPKTSWEAFEEFLHQRQVVSIPGQGFGSAGEGFLRFSALGQREELLEALSRIGKGR